MAHANGRWSSCFGGERVPGRICATAGWGWAVAMKLLVHQRQLTGTPTGEVSYRECGGFTPLFRNIPGIEGIPHLISPKAVRLVIAARADASSSTEPIMNEKGGAMFHDTPLAFTIVCLRDELEGGRKTTARRMYGLEGVHQLLLRVKDRFVAQVAANRGLFEKPSNSVLMHVRVCDIE